MTGRGFVTVAFACCLLGSVASAQSPAPSPEPLDDPSCEQAPATGWRRFACDSTALGRRLTLREPADRWRLAAILGSAGALYTLRDEIHREIRQRDDPDRTRIYDAARWSARGLASPVAAGLLLAARGLTGNPEHAETAQIVLESTLYSAALATAGSFVLAAERPEDGRAVRGFDSDGHGVSGDVAISASIAAPIDRRLLRASPGDGAGRRTAKWAGRGLLYAMVGLTAMQRMDDDKHWAPDVFLGAATGFGVGYTLCTAHARTENAGSIQPSSARVAARRPEVVLAGNGVALRWSF